MTRTGYLFTPVWGAGYGSQSMELMKNYFKSLCCELFKVETQVNAFQKSFFFAQEICG